MIWMYIIINIIAFIAGYNLMSVIDHPVKKTYDVRDDIYINAPANFGIDWTISALSAYEGGQRDFILLLDQLL